MKREQQQAINLRTIKKVRSLCRGRMSRPSYIYIVNILNQSNYKTSRGNAWTPKRLLRMLQRSGYMGVYGLSG